MSRVFDRLGSLRLPRAASYPSIPVSPMSSKITSPTNRVASFSAPPPSRVAPMHIRTPAALLELDLHQAAPGRVLGCIVDQVHDDLEQARRIPEGPHRPLGQAQLQRMAVCDDARAERLHGGADDGVQLERFH